MRKVFSILAGALIGLAVLSGCNSTDKQTAKTASGGTAQPPTIYPDGVRRVTIVELKDLLAANEAVVIDVRSADAYQTAHIKGARLIPVGEILNHTGELPKDKLIVTYCS